MLRAPQKVARAVYDETGLRTVFHHHCAGYVETPDEIARLLSMTDPEVLGLVFDTGHYAFAAGDCAAVADGLTRFADRIWYIHFKDCQPEVAAQSQGRGVGLLRVAAPRRVLRAGPGLRGLRRGGRVAGDAGPT